MMEKPIPQFNGLTHQRLDTYHTVGLKHFWLKKRYDFCPQRPSLAA